MENNSSKTGNQVNVQQIRSYMKENGLTVKAFCARCGISPSLYYRIIRGQNCNLKALFKIAKAMGRPIHLLFI